MKRKQDNVKKSHVEVSQRLSEPVEQPVEQIFFKFILFCNYIALAF